MKECTISTLRDANEGSPEFDATVDNIVRHLKASRANTIPLCTCLLVCEQCLPYREAEKIIDTHPSLAMSMQNAHALIAILVGCSAITKTEIPERDYATGEKKQDQPIDYTVETTSAGRLAAMQFEPTVRFREVLQVDPSSYAQAYAAVLQLCHRGARKADIEALLQDNRALSDPKPIYPSYFISKLETIGGLVWDGSWKTTEAGKQMLSLVG